MRFIIRFLNICLVTLTVNSVLLFSLLGLDVFVQVIAYTVLGVHFLIFNIIPTLRSYPSLRLKVLGDGAELLLIFLISCCLSIPLAVYAILSTIDGTLEIPVLVAYCIIFVLSEGLIFCNGIIRVYCTSIQLGIRHRVLGLALGLVPVANLVMLLIIYVKVSRECRTETALAKLDKEREQLQICRTKYPILLVHGVFFRDSKLLNYWGRVPAELVKNGAVIYYGEQQSAASVENSAKELAVRIEKIVNETGCEKVNIIAHSKGGLDSRYAISKLGCDRYVASLTTINTPHRGCIFAEHLLGKAPDKLAVTIESTYNAAFKKLGDTNPDFMAAVNDLTYSRCAEFNENVPDIPGVFYQSFGSKATRTRSGRFPINVSYPIVKKYDGDNDGLVALTSAQWGEKFTPVYPKGRRGITHADVIDLNREDIKGFDVREFYVQIVSELRERGF
ncbi:MAG: triacylglycerol lipase [Eubacterium sp.]|nr:triacylglycerol lipase [Eubacterium sp.]